MSGTIQDPEKVEPNYDPHRFSAEPKRKPKRTVMKILTTFVFVMAVIGGGVVAAKAQIAAYMEQRSEKQKLENEKRQAENDKQGRKTKSFAASDASRASLPLGLVKDKDPAPAPEAKDEAPAEPAVAALPQPRANPEPDSMMLNDGQGTGMADGSAAKGLPPLPLPGAKPPDGHGAGTPPPPPGFGPAAKSRGATVQQYANGVAAQATITATPQVSAADLGDRSFLLARGAYIPCILETQLVSNIEGNTSCVIPQDIYSDDGRVVLLERGSKAIGSYKSQFTGDRIAILWHRLKTPGGVVIDVDSPTADGVGTMGAQGTVERHWMERIGAAFMLSMIEDLVTFETAKATAQNQSSGSGQVVVASSANPYPTATTGQVTSISKEVLKDTLNIKPTLVKNRGDRLMVYVNRDLWFDSVYKLTQR
jgi:type IV secretion system protein VirB10